MDELPIHFSFVEGIAVVAVDRPPDYLVMRLLDAAVAELVERERHRIVLDLRNPGLSTELFVGWEMALTEELRENSIELHLTVVTDDYRFAHDCEVVGIPTFVSVSEAVASFFDDD
ncbi:MAG: hypothetical protein HKN37_01345 [Rhodothermales bacterium]|nr:hypothetical protein [Rhodothermales bacterium]